MSFEAKLEKYAKVIVGVGVNLQPGQSLLMWNPPYQAAPFGASNYPDGIPSRRKIGCANLF
jgi:leucyl aminopeptidase (aminopeptidase T)